MQLKKIYLEPEGPCLELIDEGLNPSDAERFGLLPVLSVMLTCAGTGHHYQKLFPMNQPVCLVSFLADAWQNLRHVIGVPDTLIVHPELLEAYPLVRALRAIDPTGKIAVVARRNQSIGSSLRVAQENATLIRCSDKPKTTSNSPFDLFGAVNLYLRPFYHLQGKPQDSHLDLMLGSTPSPYPLREVSVEDSFQLINFSISPIHQWLSKSADKIERLSQDQSLFHGNEQCHDWVNELYIGYTGGKSPIKIIYGVGDAFKYRNDPGNDYFLNDMLTPGCIWVSEAPGLPGGLKGLPYDVREDIGKIIEIHEFDDFLKNKRPMIYALYEEICDLILNKPGIFVASTTAVLKQVLELMECQCDIEVSIELTGEDSPQITHRLFAIQSSELTPYLLAIPKGCGADKNNTKNLFSNYCGAVDIGLGGLAALMHFVESSIEHSSSASTFIGAQMMDTMLEYFPEWT